MPGPRWPRRARWGRSCRRPAKAGPLHGELGAQAQLAVEAVDDLGHVVLAGEQLAEVLQARLGPDPQPGRGLGHPPAGEEAAGDALVEALGPGLGLAAVERDRLDHRLDP